MGSAVLHVYAPVVYLEWMFQLLVANFASFKSLLGITTSQVFSIAVCILCLTFLLSFVICHFFTAILMIWFASGVCKAGPLMGQSAVQLSLPLSVHNQLIFLPLLTEVPWD